MWTDDIEINVFSRIKAEGTIALKSKYPNLFYTTANETDDSPSFPSVYVQELPGVERGRDLEGKDINGVLSSFQVDVQDNDKEKGKARTKEVMGKVMETMKSMLFEVTALPVYRRENDVWLATARFRRVIGANDFL